jgi:hypothetical protein
VRIVGLAVRPRLSAQQKSHPADSVASLISAPFGDILLPSAAAAARGSGRPSNKYSTPAHLSPPRLAPFDHLCPPSGFSPGDPTIPRRPTKEIVPVDARPPTPPPRHDDPGSAGTPRSAGTPAGVAQPLLVVPVFALPSFFSAVPV